MDLSNQRVNVIFDLIIIICGVIMFVVSVSTFFLLIYNRSTKEKDDVNRLLNIHTFLTLIITSLFTIDMYVYTMYGHFYENNSFDGWWCKLKSSLRYSSGAAFMYSLLLHAIYRFFRIVYSMKLRLQSIRIYQYFILIQWIFNIFSILILVFLNDIRYVPDDFNCQVELINMRGMLILIPLVYCIPSLLTNICYNYTLFYYRKHNRIRSDIRLLHKTRRDMIVLKRIFIILSFMIIVGLPTLILCIIYYVSHQLPWWSRQLGWLSVAVSYACVPFILITTSPQLRNLYIQPCNRIHPQ